MTASVDDVRDVFSVALRDVPAVRSAWVSTQGDDYHLWLLIDPVDVAEERKYYQLVSILYDAFPADDFMLHVVNPNMYHPFIRERIVPTYVPTSAKRVHTPTST